MTESLPLVSVCIQTYQHADYIKECLDSILCQKTDFPFEILLGEDCSTDGTREICIEYAEKHPDIIRLFLHTRDTVIYINGNATGRYNFVYNLTHAKGKYIALCEGDDYWTDPNKLQKQVDFLENNTDFSICYHDVLALQDGQFIESNIPIYDKEFLTIVDLAKENCIHTPTCVFRNNLFDKFPDFFNSCPVGDYVLHMLNAQHGNIKRLPEKMAVYRKHSGGVWSNNTLTDRLNAWLDVLLSLISYFKQHSEVHEALKKQHIRCLNNLIISAASSNNKKAIENALKKIEKWEVTHIAQYIIEINEQSNNLSEQLNNASKLSVIINKVSLKDIFELFLRKIYYKIIS